MLVMLKLEMKNKLNFLFLFLNVMNARFSNKLEIVVIKTFKSRVNCRIMNQSFLKDFNIHVLSRFFRNGKTVSRS